MWCLTATESIGLITDGEKGEGGTELQVTKHGA